MKIDQVIMSENGNPIIHPDAGFIIVGNIYRALLDDGGIPCSGFVGNNFDLGIPKSVPEGEHRVRRYMAFTKEELLDVLNYGTEELAEYLDKRVAEDMREFSE